MTDALSTQTTTLSKRWVRKMALFFVMALGLGLWGLYDATVAWPNRGKLAARALEGKFLESLRDKGRLSARASVADPAAEHARLAKISGDKGVLDGPDRALLDWLDALKTVRRCTPEHTQIPRTDPIDGSGVRDPAQRLDQLSKITNPPKPLAKWDIPVQWIISAAGFLGAVYLLGLFFTVKSRKYSWTASEKRLTLPDGGTLLPGDIAEFDKRQWSKFLVTLLVKPGHATHAGKSLVLDLYHHEPLEEWVLEMERKAFPDRLAPGATQSSEASSQQAPGETPWKETQGVP